LVLTVLLSATLAVGAAAAPQQDPLTRHAVRVSERGRSYSINYWQYLPPRAHKTKPPVLIFLHGYGERAANGDPRQLDLLLANGPLRLVHEGHDLCFGGECFLLLAPQAVPRHDWFGPAVVPVVNAMVDRARALGGDVRRVHLTGLSMGAIGTWSYAGVGGSRIAAIVPIAGSVKRAVACKVARAPVAVLAFHGRLDDTVPVAGSIEAVESVNACHPAELALLTLYPGLGHDSWLLPPPSLAQDGAEEPAPHVQSDR
jgi:poly(3-hydroxybutyrate) depolymerase